MNDRELLELAAKAAGIEATGFEPVLGIQYVSGSEDSPFTDYFNPLTDDGDAFRLAVKLDIELLHGSPWETDLSQSVMFPLADDYDCLTQRYTSADEKLAATRRAIVRAAAEIGKGMAE